MLAHFSRLLAAPSAGGVKTRMPTMAIAVALAVSGCSSQLPSNYVRSADPAAPAPPAAYTPVIGGYVSQRPVEPGSWLEQNQNVTPRQKR